MAGKGVAILMPLDCWGWGCAVSMAAGVERCARAGWEGDIVVVYWVGACRGMFMVCLATALCVEERLRRIWKEIQRCFAAAQAGG